MHCHTFTVSFVPATEVVSILRSIATHLPELLIYG
jgi:hypothetical protein